MNKLFIALGLMGLASTSFAYNGQVEGGYTFRDYDSNAVDTSGLFELKGTFYFDNVNAKGPLNEAAFLGHNSNVYLGYAYDFTKLNTILGQTPKDETNLFKAGIEYFVDQFYVNAELGYGQESVKPPKKDYDIFTYRALAGYMPISNLLFAAGIDGYNTDLPNSDDTRFAIQAKYVAPVNNGQSINLEAGAEFGDIDEVRLGADYYINPALSLGVGYESIDYGNNTADEDTFLIRSKYFINPNFAVGGAIGFGDDLNTYNINATLRF